MENAGIPASKVIRHFDVNGKPCPGVVGWNPLTGSDAAWKSFCAAISKTVQAVEAAQTRQVAKYKRTAYSKAYKTTDALNMRTGAGTDFPIITTLKQGETFRCYGYYNVNGSTVWLYGVANGVTGYCSKKYQQ